MGISLAVVVGAIFTSALQKEIVKGFYIMYVWWGLFFSPSS